MVIYLAVFADGHLILMKGVLAIGYALCCVHQPLQDTHTIFPSIISALVTPSSVVACDCSILYCFAILV
jgi:hypothetical protein